MTDLHKDPNDQECPLCRIDPRVKLLSVILAIITIILVPAQQYLHFTLLAFWLSLIILISHRSIGFYMVRIIKIYPMIFFMTFLLPFTQTNTDSNFEILFSFGSVNIYRQGINSFFDINIRSILIFTSSLITINETSIGSMLKVLSYMRIPKWIEAIVIYMQRFIYIIASEFNRMHLSFLARSFNMTHISKIKTISKISGVYFSRLIDRSERSHISMLSRGFTGTIYTRNKLSWRNVDSGILIFNFAFLSLFLFRWIY